MFRRHYPSETVTLRFLAIRIEKRGVDSQMVARQSGQPLDVKWRACLRIFANTWNMICPENKNVAPMRLNKVVTKLIDKHLVACIDCAPGNDVAAMINAARENVDIMTERVGRRIDKILLPLANQLLKGKEKEHFPWLDFKKLIILARNNVDVIATQDEELANLPQNVRRGSCARIANDSVQGWLHRACGNLKRLQEIGANAHGNNDRHQNHLAILSPMRLPGDRRQPVKCFIQRVGCAVYSLAIFLP